MAKIDIYIAIQRKDYPEIIRQLKLLFILRRRPGSGTLFRATTG
jgi:hypothetical protein